MNLVLGVGTDNGVLVLAPGGPSEPWQLLAQGLYGRRITCMRRHPDGSLWAGASNGTVYRTLDFENWEPLFEGIKYASIYSLDVDMMHPDVVYCGTSPAALFRTIDRGRTWHQLNTLNRVPGANSWTFGKPPYQPRLTQLHIHPMRSEVIVASVEVGGILISPDAGRTWTERHKGVSKDITSVCLAPPEATRLYATCGIGFYRSDNLGVNWMHRVVGLPYLQARCLAVSEEDPDHLIIGVNRTREGGPTLFRSYSGGLSWEICPSNLNYQPSHSVTALCSGPGSFFAGTDGGELYGTSNFGDLWSKLRPTMAPIRTVAVVHRN